MDRNEKDRITSDIENQLDDFFGDDKEASAEQFGEQPAAIDPLEQLKSVVLSIDWEITDDCLVDLEQSVGKLMTRYKDDLYTFTMLRMLNSLGKYIKKRKAQAHPDAIKRVMSVFKSLEQIAGATAMPENRKKSIVAAEIRMFKELKKQVELKRGGMTSPTQSTDLGPEIKKTVDAAMASFKKELDDLTQQVHAIQAELVQLKKT